MAEDKVDVKAGATVWRGHEEGKKQCDALLEEFCLPMGLLPLQDIVEVGFVRSTGYCWITMKKKVDHTFKLSARLVSYGTEITSYMEKEHIKKLTGVKAKELLLWVSVGDISIGEDKTKIHFKGFGGITRSFDVKVFAAGQ